MDNTLQEAAIAALEGSNSVIRRLVPPIICPIAIEAARQQVVNQEVIASLKVTHEQGIRGVVFSDTVSEEKISPS